MPKNYSISKTKGELVSKIKKTMFASLVVAFLVLLTAIFYSLVAWNRFKNPIILLGLVVLDPSGVLKNKEGLRRMNFIYRDENSRKRLGSYPKVDCFTHQLGYRIDPLDSPREFAAGGVLVLGDSVSWGWPCLNRETFGGVLAQNLKTSVYNYGICSAGWLEIEARADSLKKTGILQKLKPSIVIVAAGDWWLDRSTSPYRSTWVSPLLHPFYGQQESLWSIRQPSPILSFKHNYLLTEKYLNSSNKKIIAPLFLLNSFRWIYLGLFRYFLYFQGHQQNLLYPKILSLYEETPSALVPLFETWIQNLESVLDFEPKPQLIFLRLGNRNNPQPLIQSQVWSVLQKKKNDDGRWVPGVHKRRNDRFGF